MKYVVSIAAIVALGFGFGCSPGSARTHGPDDPPGDGGTTDSGPLTCDLTDGDGDGIPDVIESDADTDGDGTPNNADDDSDGDGISDSDEAGGGNPCVPLDTDGDGTPDYLDMDADNDGLTDAEELTLGTDRLSQDTDGDGIPDVVEVRGSMTDPTDSTSAVPEGDFFVVLPYLGAEQDRTLRFGTNIEVADVFFLVDMTGSMRGERTGLINGLVDTIIPGIEAAIPNVQFGAGGMDDYPVSPYGGGNDLPFYLLREIAPQEQDLGAWSLAAGPTTCPSNAATSDIGGITGAPNGTPDILEAVQGLPCHGGSDGPESYVPSLYATASGDGLSWTGGSVPAQSCPSIPDETGTRRGYPCFRPGALPIVLLFGDYSFHNGPGGSEPYSTIAGAPTYDATVAALTGIGARVIGLFSGSGGLRSNYESIATDTGAVDATGAPLVFDIASDGSNLDSRVVDAVAQLVGGTPQDVSTRTENVAGNPDNFDATLFIKAITPIEGYEDGIAGAGYDSKDETTFYGVIPGTMVDFGINFWNDVRMPAAVSEVFVARIIVVGNGVADLSARNVYILVPREGSGPILI